MLEGKSISILQVLEFRTSVYSGRPPSLGITEEEDLFLLVFLLWGTHIPRPLCWLPLLATLLLLNLGDTSILALWTIHLAFLSSHLAELLASSYAVI